MPKESARSAGKSSEDRGEETFVTAELERAREQCPTCLLAAETGMVASACKYTLDDDADECEKVAADIIERKIPLREGIEKLQGFNLDDTGKIILSTVKEILDGGG